VSRVFCKLSALFSAKNVFGSTEERVSDKEIGNVLRILFLNIQNNDTRFPDVSAIILAYISYV
jgi:hypothetical protein